MRIKEHKSMTTQVNGYITDLSYTGPINRHYILLNFNKLPNIIKCIFKWSSTFCIITEVLFRATELYTSANNIRRKDESSNFCEDGLDSGWSFLIKNGKIRVLEENVKNIETEIRETSLHFYIFFFLLCDTGQNTKQCRSEFLYCKIESIIIVFLVSTFRVY